MDNEVPDPNPKVVQPYMQKFQAKNVANNNGQLYKYIWDPELTFSWRLQERIARIVFENRSQPWVSIVYNTGEVKPLTNMLSHTYDQIRIVAANQQFYDVQVRRVVTPVNLVFISNNIDYLYRYLQKLSFYFDRTTQYSYTQKVQYAENYVTEYTLAGMAKDIVAKDLTKLDTEKRGSLATAGYSFNLIYWDFNTPYTGYLLENLDLEIKILDGSEYYNLIIQ